MKTIPGAVRTGPRAGAAPPGVARARYPVAGIYGALREAIVSTELKPGTGVSEARLAERFGVSRTPVREALKRLAEESLIVVVPQVGSFVAPIDLRAVSDNHFVRETLECRIVALAAQRAQPADRAALRANLARQRAAMSADDAVAFFRADEEMHALLARIAGHASAWDVIHEAKGQLDRVRRLSLADSRRSRRRVDEHRAIVARVVAGDGDGAAEAMRTHLRSVFDAIENIAAEHAHYFIGLPAHDRSLADAA